MIARGAMVLFSPRTMAVTSMPRLTASSTISLPALPFAHTTAIFIVSILSVLDRICQRSYRFVGGVIQADIIALFAVVISVVTTLTTLSKLRDSCNVNSYNEFILKLL